MNIPPPSNTPQAKIDAKLVLQKLRSFPKGSAAGPTGTRASHILHAIQVKNPTSALETLTDLLII